jgi:hypothetical protein
MELLSDMKRLGDTKRLGDAWPVQRVRDLLWAGADDRALRRDADRGRVQRVSPGVYLDAALWAQLDDDERYLLRIAAIAGTRRARVVYSHYSALALLGYPIIGYWPSRVHTLVGADSGQRSSAHVVRHAMDVSDDELIELGGLVLTNPLRTLTDVARVASLETAVAALDRGLAGPAPLLTTEAAVEREALLESVAKLGSAPGASRAAFAIGFADAAAGSPGESVSRVNMHRLHIPKPQLQVRVFVSGGRYFDVDFGWEEFGAFGEFDGHGKYFKPEYRGDRTPEQVLIAEKKREDEIRAVTSRTFARWDWPIALSLPALRACLAASGVHPVRRQR